MFFLTNNLTKQIFIVTFLQQNIVVIVIYHLLTINTYPFKIISLTT